METPTAMGDSNADRYQSHEMNKKPSNELMGLTIFLVLKLLRLMSPVVLPVFLHLFQCEVQILGELSGLFRKQ